jgi:hypothetical protein
MTTIIKRYPTFTVEMANEQSSYILTYDTEEQLTQEDFEESIISFSIKNAMEDDSPVFSLVVLAKKKWDKILGSNDLVRIKAIPDRTKDEPHNPYIMVGLISDIHKEGEYGDGILLYRITGRAMTKALIDFNVGVIQEVATIITGLGWLPDDPETGLQFSGNTAAGIGSELMERFVYEYAEYNFEGNKTLKDYFDYEFNSWTEDEALADVTPFINYQGSLRQFLEDVSAKPFNELFFEYTNEGKCKALMRPTPFDPDNWDRLPLYRFTSDIVVEESIGKSDSEMFSVFVVQAPNSISLNSMDLGVYPKFNPDLIKKYGYKRLDAENRYLLTAHLVGEAEEDEEEGEEIPVEPPMFEEVLTFITDNGYEDPEVLRTQRETVYSEMLSYFPTMSESLIDSVIDSVKEGDFTREEYNILKDATGDSEVDQETNAEKSIAQEKLEEYTQRLYNWYCENANFYGGDLRVLGHPMYRIGSKIQYEDFEQDTVWEFYVESVQHEFSFSNGYTTILGVTRGLPDYGTKRFSNLWGMSEDFKGGYLGELSQEELLEKAQQSDTSGDGVREWGRTNGGNTALNALNTALGKLDYDSVYTFGGGRSGNPFLSTPIETDCSSFVWWCYYENGVSLKGGKTGMTTDTIKVDSRLKTITPRGSSKELARSFLQIGDLVYFDTYKNDGHVGIYAGEGTFVGSQSSSGIATENMKEGYWWQKFNGHVLRYINAELEGLDGSGGTMT